MKVAVLAWVLSLCVIGVSATGGTTVETAQAIFTTSNSGTFNGNDPFGNAFPSLALNQGGDGRWYKFKPASDGTCQFETTSASYDTYLYLVSEDCANNPGVYTTVTQDDDGGSGLLSRIRTTCYSNLVYYVGVGGYSSNSGSYSLAASSPRGGAIICRKWIALQLL